MSSEFVVIVGRIWEFPKIRGYLRVPLKGSLKGSIRVL